MRQQRSLLAVGLASALLVTGCNDGGVFGQGVRGSGNPITETRDVSGFDEIVLTGSGNVVVTVTGTEALTIEAEDNIMPLLTSTVRNGRLELGTTSSFSATRPITYTITAAALTAVEISGSGSVTASGLDTHAFESAVSGSGSVTANGKAGDLAVVISGSGSFDGEELTATNAKVTVGGSGSAVVNAADTLDVDIGGSGSVQYLGDPSVTTDIGGSGSVSRR